MPLPAWARTDAVAAERIEPAPSSQGATVPSRGGVSSLRDRLRGAADGVRSRAGDLRDRVTGSDADRPGGPGDEPLPHAPGTEQQPAFPWSTEEFVASRHDDTGTDLTGTDVTGTDVGATGSADTAEPARSARPPRWDTTDQIADDELPWWRRPKHDA